MSELRGDGPPLVDDVEHAADCHERWLEGSPYRERGGAAPGQCLFCRFYVPLAGALGEDWGVCSNAASAHDGHVMFEHDGCPQYSPANHVWEPGHGPSTPEERERADQRALQIWLTKHGLPPDFFGGS